VRHPWRHQGQGARPAGHRPAGEQELVVAGREQDDVEDVVLVQGGRRFPGAQGAPPLPERRVQEMQGAPAAPGRRERQRREPFARRGGGHESPQAYHFCASNLVFGGWQSDENISIILEVSTSKEFHQP
jgi:hypothetical protein